MGSKTVRSAINKLLLVCCVPALLASCHKSAAPAGSADVMFVNGCLYASSVGAKANYVSIDGASGINFLANSGYSYVAAGQGVNLTFFDGSGSFISKAVDMTGGRHYSAFAGGEAGSPVYLFTEDDLTAPAPGNAKIRFVNLSPDNINETGVVNDTIVAQNVTLSTASSFYEVRAAASYITIFDPANKNITVQADSVALGAGRIYTVLLTGTSAGTGTNGLTFTVINNN